jgi:hypothetical protein
VKYPKGMIKTVKITIKKNNPFNRLYLWKSPSDGELIAQSQEKLYTKRVGEKVKILMLLP